MLTFSRLTMAIIMRMLFSSSFPFYYYDTWGWGSKVHFLNGIISGGN